MSNIFNLLGGIAESDRNQAMNPILRSKTFHEIKLNKGVGGMKPKGLSIRSISDMNVSHSAYPVNAKKNLCDNKEQDCMKLKVTQVDTRGCPISPGRKTPGKKLISEPFKFKESLKEETLIIKDTKSQKTIDSIFKKPLPPKKNVKKFCEPEKLAYWYDAQEEFDHGYIDTIEKEIKDLLSKEKENIKPNKKEKLKSDPEMLVFSNVPKLVLDKSFDEDYKKLSPIELPEISDLSDID